MGLGANIKGLHGALVDGPNKRQIVLPAGAAVTLTANAAGSTYGVWADIALLATVQQRTLLVGVVVSAPSVTDVFTIDIGSTQVLGVAYVNAAAVIAGGVAVVAAAHRAELRADYGVVVTTAVGTHGWVGGYLPLPYPILIPNGTGIIGRCYGITAAAVTIGVSAVCLQGF